MKNTITFTPHLDIVADSHGVYLCQSGCTPYHPDETRFFFRNAEYKYRLHSDDTALVAAAADAGDEHELLSLLRRIYMPVGRSAECGGWI